MSSLPSCFRLFATKIPTSLHPKSLISTKPPNLPFSRSINFQKIRTTPSSSASSPSSAPLQPVEELPPKLQEIVRLFQMVQDPRSKYEQLLFYGKNLKPLDSQFKIGENKVQGCVSQVWVRAFLDPDRNVLYEADSDSVLTKGLAALLVQGLSGRPVAEILRVSPDFAVLLGLHQSLTPSRNNGFLNMLKLMQRKALELFVESEKELESNSESCIDVGTQNSDSKLGLKSEVEIDVNDLDTEGIKMGEIESSSSDLGSRGERIKNKLEKELSPVELEVEDVSYQHAGHAGVRGSDGETHFNVKIVSNEFEGKSLVKRHRLVYSLLQEELQRGLHALSIVAKTPSEMD